MKNFTILFTALIGLNLCHNSQIISGMDVIEKYDPDALVNYQYDR